jgi:hypothetical protein
VSHDGVHAVVKAFDVHSNHTVEVVFSRAFDRSDVRDPGVVNQNVNVVAVEKSLDPGFHFHLIRYIANVSRGNPASGGDLLAGCCCSGLVYVQNANHCAMRREFQSDGLPNAAAAARDYRDFAVQAKSACVGFCFFQRETPRFQGMKSS